MYEIHENFHIVSILTKLNILDAAGNGKISDKSRQVGLSGNFSPNIGQG